MSVYHNLKINLMHACTAYPFIWITYCIKRKYTCRTVWIMPCFESIYQWIVVLLSYKYKEYLPIQCVIFVNVLNITNRSRMSTYYYLPSMQKYKLEQIILTSIKCQHLQLGLGFQFHISFVWGEIFMRMRTGENVLYDFLISYEIE